MLAFELKIREWEFDMKVFFGRRIFCFLGLLSLYSLACSSICLAELTETNQGIALAKAEKVILQFTGDELSPQNLSFNKLESSAFFVNRSEETAVNLSIDFTDKGLHCHSTNLKLGADGYLRSTTPIKPRDFAVLCFPLNGVYAFSVTETSGKKRTFTGEVTVHE